MIPWASVLTTDQRDKEGSMDWARESQCESNRFDAWQPLSSQRETAEHADVPMRAWRTNNPVSCAPTWLLVLLCCQPPSKSFRLLSERVTIDTYACRGSVVYNPVEQSREVLRATKTANNLPHVKLFFIFTCSCRRYMCSLIQMPNSKEG